jgi:hypothetical protein
MLHIKIHPCQNNEYRETDSAHIIPVITRELLFLFSFNPNRRNARIIKGKRTLYGSLSYQPKELRLRYIGVRTKYADPMKEAPMLKLKNEHMNKKGIRLKHIIIRGVKLIEYIR